MYKILMLVIFIFPSLAYSMSVESNKISASNIMILKGAIEKNDLKKIQNHIAKNGYPTTVYIRSPGGDVEESLKIGRFFNKSFIEINAVVECNSSCFFVWAGAYKRETSVSLGLHRPYFDKSYFSGLTATQAKIKYNELTESVRKYLLEMDVPVSFIDTMMSTDSENVWYVHEEQLPGKISEYAPAQREWILSKCSDLTSDEKNDYDASISCEMYQSLSNSNDPDEYKEIMQSIREKAEYGKGLSAGYVSYLKNKSREIYQCENKAIKQARNSIELK